MLSKFESNVNSDAERKRLREEINQRHEQARVEQSLTKNEGAAVYFLFLGFNKRPNEKATAPKHLLVCAMDVNKLTNAHDSPFYRVDDEQTVSFPIHDGPALKEKRKELKELRDKKSPKDVIDAKTAELHEVQAINKGWAALRDGDILEVSTFSKQNLGSLQFLDQIKCIDFVAEYSKFMSKPKNGEAETEREETQFGCGAVVRLSDAFKHSIGQTLKTRLNIFQRSVRINEENPWANQVVLFSNYDREDPAEGPISMRVMSNPGNPEMCYYKNKNDNYMLRLKLIMTEVSDDGSANEVSVTIMEYENEDNKAAAMLLRETFGIHDHELFGKIMAVNPVPLILVGTVDLKKSCEGSIEMYPHNHRFLLRDYLLSNCMQVSYEYVKNKLCTDASTLVQLDEHNNALNLRTLKTQNKKKVLVGEKVACVSYFNGLLSNLGEQGCQFRIMHTRAGDKDTRAYEASMPTTETEPIVDRLDAYLIYAVMPYDEERLPESSEKKTKAE